MTTADDQARLAAITASVREEQADILTAKARSALLADLSWLLALVQQQAAQIETLTAALTAHGKHPDYCPKGVGIGYYKPTPDALCNCGIDAALASSPATKEQG